MTAKFSKYVYTSASGSGQYTPEQDKPGLEYLGQRKFADVVAIIAHITFIIIAGARGDIEKDSYILLLAIMSGITAFFHMIYFYGLFHPDESTKLPGWFNFRAGTRNTLKWAEYSITATLGTVALATSNVENEPELQIILFLIAVAVTEQTTGYAIDAADDPVLKDSGSLLQQMIVRNFFTTFLCQAGEFGVLGIYKEYTSLAWIWYTVTWSLFGVWAGVRLVYPTVSIGLSELVYTWLSTIAKIGLFAAVMFDTP